jgi:hypothetical protein
MLDENVGFNLQNCVLEKRFLADALTDEELKNYGEERDIEMKDEVFEDIKDMGMGSIGNYLGLQFQECTRDAPSKDEELKAYDLEMTKKLAQKTKLLKMVKKHSAIASELRKIIENPLNLKSLRLEQEMLGGEPEPDSIFNFCLDLIARNYDLSKI